MKLPNIICLSRMVCELQITFVWSSFWRLGYTFSWDPPKTRQASGAMMEIDDADLDDLPVNDDPVSLRGPFACPIRAPLLADWGDLRSDAGQRSQLNAGADNDTRQ